LIVTDMYLSRIIRRLKFANASLRMNIRNEPGTIRPPAEQLHIF
jgi:hypothetical protein